jgi:membrane protein
MVSKKVDDFFSKTVEVIRTPIMQVLPGQLAFHFVLSLIPIISLVALMGNIFSISIDNFIEFINESFPAATSSLIIPLIEGKGFDISVFVFMISAFLLASNGTYSIVVISNLLYKVNGSSYIRNRIKAVLLTFMIVLLLGFIIVVPAFGSMILSVIKNFQLVRPISDDLIFLYRIFEIPISFLFIFFSIKLIYTIAPEKRIKSKDSTYGAFFTSVGWILATKIYSYYVSVFVSYDIFYGSIANLITLLIWIYLLSYIFVIGLALNANRDNKKEV